MARNSVAFSSSCFPPEVITNSVRGKLQFRLKRDKTDVVGIQDVDADGFHADPEAIQTDLANRRHLYVDDVLTSSNLHGLRRDGVNATREISRMVTGSRFFDHLQVILLQGIALAGFNVVDIGALHQQLGRAVMVVVRRPPDQDAVRRALIAKVRWEP